MEVKKSPGAVWHTFWLPGGIKAHANRKVKDRLFRYIFENDKEALLQLYNALNETDYQNPEELEIITVRNVLYLSMKNDLAFLLTGTMNLYEHQSTYNPNMPLRFLWYLGQEYQMFVERHEKNVYGSTLITLPTPQCVVFYNGDKDMADEEEIFLSEAFEKNGKEPCVELKVRMININFGRNEKMMKQCRKLWEYSYFIDCMKQKLGEGMPLRKAMKRAIQQCIDQNVMADFLRENRMAVPGMILTEYDEKKVMQMMKRDAKEEGREEGKKEGREETAALYQKLKAEGRMDDLMRAIDDAEYRKGLLENMD